jgi:hypothetical protein
MEWQSLVIMSAPGLIYLGLATFAGVTIARSPRPLRIPILTLVVTLAILPLTAVRHLQLFAIGLPILLADDFAAVWRRTNVPATASRWEKTIVIATTAVAGSILIVLGARDASCIRIDPARAIPFPVRAVDVLERSGVEGNMATYFDWGEYAIWHLYPDIRVSMDGRRETVYSESVYQEYLAFQRGSSGDRSRAVLPAVAGLPARGPGPGLGEGVRGRDRRDLRALGKPRGDRDPENHSERPSAVRPGYLRPLTHLAGIEARRRYICGHRTAHLYRGGARKGWRCRDIETSHQGIRGRPHRAILFNVFRLEYLCRTEPTLAAPTRQMIDGIGRQWLGSPRDRRFQPAS